jgi:hypothetical protein
MPTRAAQRIEPRRQLAGAVVTAGRNMDRDAADRFLPPPAMIALLSRALQRMAIMLATTIITSNEFVASQLPATLSAWAQL